MFSHQNKFIGILLVFSLLVLNSGIGFAEENSIPQANVPKENSNSAAPINGTPQQDAFMSKLKQELNLTKTDYKQLINSINQTKGRLVIINEEKMTYQEQLDNLDIQIANTTENLLNVLKDMVQTENQVKILMEEIEAKEVALAYQKQLLTDYIRIIYQEENDFFRMGDDGSINTFRLLLADGSVGENLRDLDYFELLNETSQQMIEKLDFLSNELEVNKTNLKNDTVRLEKLQIELENDKRELELQREGKERILKITEGQEKIYEQLLEQSVLQQEQLVQDIKNLNNSVGFIEKKIQEEGSAFNPQNYLSLLDFRTRAVVEFKLKNLGSELGEFQWPVEPYKGISAYFRDAAYVGVFGVRHNAVDIPQYQGSAVRAAADGVVYRAKDNGYGYSYIIIAHSGGFNTVYGHISEILVSEGDSVSAGSIIGLSGGMPGTKGAGYMTTGPHLHFEMLLNNLYVDPMSYLPLNILDPKYAEKLPEKYLDDYEADLLKASTQSVLRF